MQQYSRQKSSRYTNEYCFRRCTKYTTWSRTEGILHSSGTDNTPAVYQCIYQIFNISQIDRNCKKSLRPGGERAFDTSLVPDRICNWLRIGVFNAATWCHQDKVWSLPFQSLIRASYPLQYCFNSNTHRMQSIHASQVYGSTLRCIQILLRQEGPLVFWSGIWHRLGRLSIASAIMFPV
jgi:hypothetical protein